MEEDDLNLCWEDSDIKSNEEIIAHSDHTIAAENLVYLSQDVSYMVTADLAVDPSVECVTEEVITDDWVIGVEVPMEQLVAPICDIKLENDLDVPLPTDQDEYTAMRPFPCDFCSRRFRKKAALMNHMVAHQNDRPHVCNLCGVRYVRKCDLMNHLKVHAYIPDDAQYGNKWRNRAHDVGADAAVVAAGSYEAPLAPLAPLALPVPLSFSLAPRLASLRAPFTSRAPRPVETLRLQTLWGWIRKGKGASVACPGDDMDFRLSPLSQDRDHRERVRERGVMDKVRGPELFCEDCGVAFQRVDLLRRHVTAAHRFKKSSKNRNTPSSNSGKQFPCRECGAYQYTCAVCSRSLPSSGELVQHLIRHCDENTAMKRMPLAGPRKYKRRRKMK
ncbi:unnamed protein product, partial [Leptidea sinapis]